MLPLLPLLRFWKIGAAAILVVAGIVVFLSYRSSLIQIGYDRGMAEWAADEAREREVAFAADIAERAKETAAAVRNQEIEREHAENVAAALADRDRTFRLLQRARATTDSIHSGQVESLSRALAASEAGRAEQIDGALADTITEARINADTLDALVLEVKPQVN